MRSFMISMLFVFISACANQPTQEAVSQQRWVGQNADTLVSRLGPPTSTFTTGEGDRVFQYSVSTRAISDRDAELLPLSTYLKTGPALGTIVQAQRIHSEPFGSSTPPCEIRFTVDKTNTIISATSRGSDCADAPSPRL